jgi:NTP pyrophosphatase (non-canonical NTP hydrolase)
LTKSLTLNDYQSFTATTAIYPNKVALEYLSLGLVAEAGEFAGKIAKWYRKDNEFPVDDLVDELGDILWFIAQMATYLNRDLSYLADRNKEKLTSRQARGVLKGSGDNR